MTQINAQVVADSINPQGDRITTMLITFPRFLLAELNTHRTFSKNSASSRAIPFEKMVKSVQEDPFTPIAWQKDHKGMQGTEYITDATDLELNINGWLKARDNAVSNAKYLNHGVKEGRDNGVTKQLCNRLLEPFMWHTVLITSTEWENFFELRCPQYTTPVAGEGFYAKSWKELQSWHSNPENEDLLLRHQNDTLFKLQHNKGQAEIHMMALAEAMYDALNESKPIRLSAGVWHIPFMSSMDLNRVRELCPIEADPILDKINFEMTMVKLSTVMAARTSYTVVGDSKEPSYERMLEIYSDLVNSNPFHASPFEHCAKAMDDLEYYSHIRGKVRTTEDSWGIYNLEYYPKITQPMCEEELIGINPENKDRFGRVRNFKGWKQLRVQIEEEKRKEKNPYENW